MARLRATTVAIIFALILVVLLVLIYLFSPYRCFLDVLNAQIARGAEFRPFYAGYPGLPPTREVIPELGELEDAFPIVQAEALRVFRNHLAAQNGAGGEEVPRMDSTYNHIFLRGTGFGAGIRNAAMRLIYGDGMNIFDKIGSDDWRTFNLILYNYDVPGNADKCPTLVRLLKRIPGMQSALISIIAPGAYIPPHSDPAKGVIRYHLAFLVPRDRKKCFIEVDGLRYSWKEGEGVLFDDVYDHWVQNKTDEYRVVLFVDILRSLSGVPRALQALANLANRHHPGVWKLIRESRVRKNNL